MFIKGTPGPLILDELVRSDSDIEIVKKRYSMFYGTDFDLLLLDLQIDSLILAGVNSHACIRTAAIDAYQRDWEVILASDCVDSYDREHHAISMKYMKDKIAKVLSNQEIRLELAP